MRTLSELVERLRFYRAANYIYRHGMGYLVWHFTTGENLEFLFIEVAEEREGFGTELFRMMAQQLVEEGHQPYHSVIGYRLAAREKAGAFYRKLGFREVNLGRSVYRDDDTILMWIPWLELRTNLEV